MSRGVDLAVLKELLEKELEELERKLQLYRALLELVNERLGSKTSQENVAGREFRGPDGRLVAVLVHKRDRIVLNLYKPVPESDPYLKYALRVLEKLSGESEAVEYTVEKEDDKVKSITVLGVSKDVVDDVVAALEYTAIKLSSRR